MSIFSNAAGVLSGASFSPPTPFTVVGGSGQLTVTSQPTQPAAPTVTGGSGQLTVTG